MNRNIFITTQYLVAFLLLCSLSSFCQVLNKGSRFAALSTGFIKPITPEYFENITPLMLNGKAGWFFRNNLSVSVEANITRYCAPFYKKAELQPYYEAGTNKDNSFSIGITLGKHFPLSKNFFLAMNIYAHHLHNRYKEESILMWENGDDVGIEKTLEVDNNYAGRIGVNTEVDYFFTSAFSGTLRLTQIDIRVRRGWHTQVYLEAPVMLGVSYHFKK